MSIALLLTAKNSSYVESPKMIARIVTPTIHRWKRLAVEIPCFPSFNEIPSERFEALEHHSISGFETQTDPVFTFQSSPRLQSFTFYSTRMSRIHLLHLPWSQLAHLELTDVSPDACRAVLFQCTHLVSGEFTTCCTWEAGSAATEPPVVTLPSLERLALTFQGVATPNEIHAIEAFLVPLALPSLKTLSLDFDSQQNEFWPTQAVTSFQSRCPNIEEIA